MKKGLIFLFILPFILFAVETQHDEKEYLTGSGFDLVKTGDNVEGIFNGFPLIGEKKCGEYFRGVLKEDSGERAFAIQIVSGKVLGDFAGKSVAYAGYDKEKQNILIKAANTVIPVHFTYDTIADGHFVNPIMTFTYAFKTYKINLNGKSCMSSLMFYCVFLVGIVTL